MLNKYKILLSVLSAALLLGFYPAQAKDAPKQAVAVLAGGCFWCMESDFDKLPGVTETVSGYTGGTIENPTYDNYHDAGENIVPHIEALKITYDSAKISYAQLLDYYFRHIDPTDNGGQFCDRGPSYRPAIFTNNAAERKAAETASAAAEKALGQKIKVDLLDAKTFYAAEDYHQDYHNKNTTKYKFYRFRCGRDQRVEELWNKKAK